MSDIKSFDSAKFGEYLLSNAIIRQGTEKFYVHWTRLFHQERTRWNGYKWPDQLAFFLDHLDDTGRFQDWQIRQADQAVRLYFTSFMKEYNINDEPEPLVEMADDNSFTSESALKAFKVSLRLKNYSLRTEKTYLKWTKKFLHYNESLNENKQIARTM